MTGCVMIGLAKLRPVLNLDAKPWNEGVSAGDTYTGVGVEIVMHSTTRIIILLERIYIQLYIMAVLDRLADRFVSFSGTPRSNTQRIFPLDRFVVYFRTTSSWRTYCSTSYTAHSIGIYTHYTYYL